MRTTLDISDDVLFAARNPQLPSRDRRRAAVVAASIGQVLMARRARALPGEKKALADDLRRILLAYLAPLLDPAPAKPRRTLPRSR